MAEAVLFNIAEGIIKKLGLQVSEEIKLWKGVKDELEKLKATVSAIEAVLLHAEEQSVESPRVKNWLGMLSEAMYDADDLLDEFSTDALQQQLLMSGSEKANKVRLFFSSYNQFAYGHKMAHKIKSIRDRLDEIAGSRRFPLEECTTESPITTRSGRKQTHSSPPEVVVGRVHDKEAIIELLLSSDYDENVSIVPIIGIGGLGKTTLAQLVYNEDKFKMHFELKMWVCVSDDFDIKSIVKRILESATHQKPNSSEMDALKNLLHKEINGRKYLLVLDDVWNEDFSKWSDLKDLLAGGARGSKIVITTGLEKVAEMTRPICIYKIRGLNKAESWSLFKRLAFKGGSVPSPSHKAIGKEIVAKCLGVPLVIKTIAGLLYYKDLESDWLSFKNKELSKIEDYQSDILSILKLSYNHLPSHYKHCFAYCSLFPKDYEINVNELIQLWMAQGYVKPSHDNECVEDVGRGYFMDLFCMSFFQEVERDVYGNIESCKMHDLMHDLAISVAGENFVTPNSKMLGINEKTRHISAEFDWDSILKAKKLRTLLRLVGRKAQIREEECRAMFCKLRCLRVLYLSWLGIKKVPKSIFKLKHLRYVDLSLNRDIKKLPNSITKLQNLQVLRLSSCSNLRQFPKDIRRLVNLRHLDNSSCYGLTHMPLGIGQLTRLEKLSRFVVAKDYSVSKHSGGLDELNALNKLRAEMEIMNLRYVKNSAFEFKAANLKEKQHLHELSLYWNERFNYDEDDEDDRYYPNDEIALEELRPHANLKGLTLSSYRGAKFPSWFSSLTNLVSMSLVDCTSVHCLPHFDHLSCLKHLGISGLTNLEFMELCDGGCSTFFSSLTKLLLVRCPNLKGFITEAELPCFPCLTDLDIRGCPNLTWLPFFPSLKELLLGKEGTKSLKNVLKMATTSISESNSFSAFSVLSQLKKLVIWEMEDLEMEELLQNLSSLENLEFMFCPMKTMCSDEKDDGDGREWRGLKSLHYLLLYELPNLECLPKGLQYVTTLQRVEVYGCPNLKCLPEWMSNLTSLQYLIVQQCPLLFKRCNHNMAEDWPSISHIPNIEIEYEDIQRSGSYRL